MNVNEFYNVYIYNSFKLILVLPIIYSYDNIFFLVLFIEYITTIFFLYYKSTIELYSCKFFTTVNYLSIFYLVKLSLVPSLEF